MNVDNSKSDFVSASGNHKLSGNNSVTPSERKQLSAWVRRGGPKRVFCFWSWCKHPKSTSTQTQIPKTTSLPVNSTPAPRLPSISVNPTTDLPTTNSPTTNSPTTNSPTTNPPTTNSPSSASLNRAPTIAFLTITTSPKSTSQSDNTYNSDYGSAPISTANAFSLDLSTTGTNYLGSGSPINTEIGSNSKSDSTGIGAISSASHPSHVGGIVGGIVGALCFFLLIFAWLYRRRQRKNRLAPSAEFLSNPRAALPLGFGGDRSLQFRQLDDSNHDNQPIHTTHSNRVPSTWPKFFEEKEKLPYN